MTRIDFYSNAQSKLHTACRIAARAWQTRHKVVILVPDDPMTRAIDKLLWTYRPISFLPHTNANARHAIKTPILIANNLEIVPHTDVLLNLTQECPSIYSRFTRLIEIVGIDSADKVAARARWKHYKDRGYSVIHHDFSKADSKDASP